MLLCGSFLYPFIKADIFILYAGIYPKVFINGVKTFYLHSDPTPFIYVLSHLL